MDRIDELLAERQKIKFADVKDFNEYAEKYWDVNLLLFQEITKLRGTECQPEITKVLNIPAAIISLVIDMEVTIRTGLK